jgi:hypothetical protein
MSVPTSCLQPPDACRARETPLTRIEYTYNQSRYRSVYPDLRERLTTYIAASSHRHTRAALLQAARLEELQQQ